MNHIHMTAPNDNFGLPYSDLKKDRYISYSDRYLVKIGKRYYIDNNEQDQGISGTGNSVKDLVDAIGVTDEAILVFSHHPENGNTTNYTFSTDEIIPSNIILEFQNVALLYSETIRRLLYRVPKPFWKILMSIARQTILIRQVIMIFRILKTTYPLIFLFILSI